MEFIPLRVGKPCASWNLFGYTMDMRSSSTGEERFKFTGKERDVETNYDYFGARYYDSRIGRWLQVDPLAEKYPGWSPYNYVKDDPINRFDPDGRTDWKKVALGVVTVVGGGLETASGFSLAAATGITVGGAVAGVALGTHGLSTVGFGIANIAAGFADNKTEIPSGPLGAFGKGFDQNLKTNTFEKMGDLGDAFVGLTSTNFSENINKITSITSKTLTEASITLKDGVDLTKSAVDFGAGMNSLKDAIKSGNELIDDTKNGNKVSPMMDFRKLFLGPKFSF